MASANSSCSVRSEKFFIAPPPCGLYSAVGRSWTLLRPNALPRKSGEVKAIQVHHLGPRSRKVAHKRLLRVGTCIDFREGSELGVRTEDEIDAGAGPLQLAGRAVANLEHIFGFRGRLPFVAHVEQVHKEVIGECLWPLREDALLRLSEVCVQGAHAADQNRHL